MGIAPPVDRTTQPVVINDRMCMVKKNGPWFSWMDNNNSLEISELYHTNMDSQRCILRSPEARKFTDKIPIAITAATPLGTKKEQIQAQKIVTAVANQSLCNSHIFLNATN